uniref:Retrovirus-related Pol polyprotein from transposon TNT 1-94 n=1 Tax=Cajanus cajan TaxID=3821 RepID=A0A151RGR1_CAJCA|nr:Retrovirus-related Pol polyprotein from transposon TNT 1-94 [Cajanus cajan]
MISFRTCHPRRRPHILDLVHTDVCTMDAKTLSGYTYFVTFIDDHSRKVWAFVLKSKDQVLDVFKHFHASVEREIGKLWKCIRVDNGGEYRGPSKHYCKDHHIKLEKTVLMVESQRAMKKLFNMKRRINDINLNCNLVTKKSNYRSPRRVRSLVDIYETCNLAILELESFEAASKQQVWVKAMEEEIKMIEKNNTWDLVDYPKDKDIIRVKWVYKTKLNPDDTIQKHKARLVAKGYSQQPGADYNETFALVACLDTIRALIALATQKGTIESKNQTILH